MIILVDAGNTRIKFGWLRGGPDGEREETALALPHESLTQLPRWLEGLPCSPHGALGVNVAGPAMARQIEQALERVRCPIRWVSAQHSAVTVHNGYDMPEQLGADRWVSMLGLAGHAKDHAEQPLMLASFGTATTIDTLSPADSSGWRRFEGGVIFPGPALMRTSLARGTANLPEADGDTALYPTHTHQAISTGIASAQAGAVLRQWLAGLDRFQQPPRIFCAGGGWPIVRDETCRLIFDTQRRVQVDTVPIEWLATPVLDGLAALTRTCDFSSC